MSDSDGIVQREVLDIEQAAELLGISVKTAMSHREHVMAKLGLHSRTELIKFALREGIIRVEE